MIEYREYLFTAINNISLKNTKEIYNKVLNVLLFINDRSKGEHNLLLVQPRIVRPEEVGWPEIENMLNSKSTNSVELIPTNNENKTWLVEINQEGESNENEFNIVMSCREIKN